MSEAERRKAALKQLGNANFHKLDKVSTELFALTYGALVKQILADYESTNKTNEQLKKLGYNIGTKIVDEFLAKANIGACHSLAETAEILAKVAFKMFLGTHVDVVDDGAASTPDAFRLRFADNPLAEFVELPDEYAVGSERLEYSGLLCGIIRGALEMVGMRVEAQLSADTLWGDEATEISVRLVEMIDEVYMDDDD